MATQKNDQRVLDLKSKIEEKKLALKKSEKFQPVTNCSLQTDGKILNINVLDKPTLIQQIVKLSVYADKAKELGYENYIYAGFPINDWIKDLKSRFANLDRKLEEDRLRILEAKLHNLLSTDKKVELEIDDYEKEILG